MTTPFKMDATIILHYVYIVNRLIVILTSDRKAVTSIITQMQ